MHAGHILLGGPWQFDKDTIHYGRENSTVFKFKRKKIKVEPLTPRKVFRDQFQMQQMRETEKRKETASAAPMASSIEKGGKADSSIQGKSSKIEIEWKKNEKTERVEKGGKAESMRV